MPILKKKMSASAWILVAIIVIAIISLPILHMVGVLDLSFIGDAFMGYVSWQASDAMCAVLGALGWVAVGAISVYILKTYFIGTQVPVTAGTYTPVGQSISSSQTQEEDVVVSD